MSAQDGAKFLLAVGNGGAPEVFTTIGGLRLTALDVRGDMQNASNVEAGQWRRGLSLAGARSARISGSGMFTDSAAENTLRSLAFSGAVANYRISFPAGKTLTGAFFIGAYERRADVNAEEQFSVTLESAGVLSYI